MSRTQDIPHIIKYMGSKRNILDFVVDSINEIRKSNEQRLYDLFAGSAIVSGAFREIMPVTCNDIQTYSKIVGGIYLNNYHWDKFPSDIIDSIVSQIQERAKKFMDDNQNIVFDYKKTLSFEEVYEMEEQQRSLINHSFNGLPHLFAKNFSGTYWSYKQCVWIDSIASIAIDNEYKDTFISDLIFGSLMFAMAYCSQSTGHYAQYRDIKEENVDDVLIYRKKSILPLFEKKLRSLKEYYDGSNNTNFGHKFTSLDYLDAIEKMENNSIVYADPPYQFVHYSRFYHALETLVRYDYPELKYKGRYRTDRHQSPFCIRTQVKKAFSDLFEKVFEKESSLVLSYSNSGMISLEELKNLAEKKFIGYHNYVKELDYLHSTMGRQGDKNRSVKEVLLICNRK